MGTPMSVVRSSGEAMAMISIELESPTTREAIELLEQSEALSTALYPPESRHIASAETLSDDSVRFFVARLDGRAVGCGALMVRTGRGAAIGDRRSQSRCCRVLSPPWLRGPRSIWTVSARPAERLHGEAAATERAKAGLSRRPRRKFQLDDIDRLRSAPPIFVARPGPLRCNAPSSLSSDVRQAVERHGDFRQLLRLSGPRA